MGSRFLGGWSLRSEDTEEGTCERTRQSIRAWELKTREFRGDFLKVESEEITLKVPIKRYEKLHENGNCATTRMRYTAEQIIGHLRQAESMNTVISC